MLKKFKALKYEEGNSVAQNESNSHNNDIRSISHKNRIMPMFIINATLLTLCHFDKFQPTKGHLQGVRKVQFDSRVNTVSYQM